MCKDLGEDVDHLLLHCWFVSRLWFTWFGVQWVMPSTVKLMMFSWNCGRRRWRHKAWNIALLALMWVLWRQKHASFWRGGDQLCTVESSRLSLIFLLVHPLDPCRHRRLRNFCRKPFLLVGSLLFWHTSCIRAFVSAHTSIKSYWFIKKKKREERFI